MNFSLFYLFHVFLVRYTDIDIILHKWNRVEKLSLTHTKYLSWNTPNDVRGKPHVRKENFTMWKIIL